MAGRLGELLVRENLISLQQLQKAQEEQKKAGGRIGYHLTKLGFIEESELTNFLSKQYGVPSINLKEFDIDQDLYGRMLRVEFVHRLRDERRFPNVEALKAQIARDVATARGLLAG